MISGVFWHHHCACIYYLFHVQAMRARAKGDTNLLIPERRSLEEMMHLVVASLLVLANDVNECPKLVPTTYSLAAHTIHIS